MTGTDLHLTLVRHGATAWNDGGRWQGTTDNPLAASGEAQASALAPRFEGQAFELAFSSDLTRAVQTAELVLPGHPLILDPRLREIHFGQFEGLKVPEMQRHPEYPVWQADPWRVGPPGGESLAEVAARLRAWVEDLSGGRVIAFSHSVAIRTLLVDLFGWPLMPQPDYPVPYAFRLGHAGVVDLRRVGGHWTLHV